MQITSSAFRHGSPISARFTCDGANISPDLSWTEAPRETGAFAIIFHDPDAPHANGFTHWVVYNIPGTVNGLPENLPRQALLEGLGMQGKNDAGRIGYIGPCPPSGTHRYFIRLYALRHPLNLQPGATAEDVVFGLEDNVIEEADLLGTYAKKALRAA